MSSEDETPTAPASTLSADSNDTDRSIISDEDQRPSDLKNDDVFEQRQSNPRRLRFGVGVKEAQNVDLKNETAKVKT